MATCSGILAMMLLMACAPSEPTGEDPAPAAAVGAAAPSALGADLPGFYVAGGVVALEFREDGTYCADVVNSSSAGSYLCLSVEGNGCSRGRWIDEAGTISFAPSTDDRALWVDFAEARVVPSEDGLRFQAAEKDLIMDRMEAATGEDFPFGFYSGGF
jgi:hypothetical protein